MPTEIEIKTCPFCGGEALVHLSSYSYKTRGRFYFCQCEDCHSQGQTTRAPQGIEELFDTPQLWTTEAALRAIRLWNRRAK